MPRYEYRQVNLIEGGSQGWDVEELNALSEDGWEEYKTHGAFSLLRREVDPVPPLFGTPASKVGIKYG